MSRVITFSRVFPSSHYRKGHQTYFVERIYNSIFDDDGDWSEAPGGEYNYVVPLNVDICGSKHHTIRYGKRWNVGDKFSPRVWAGKPYHSKMITIAPDIVIKKVWDFEISDDGIFIDGELYAYSSSTEALRTLATNDGLELIDFLSWFNWEPFKGQIICWNESIEY